MKPFRWDVRKREQLGALASGEVPATYDGFVHDLRRCAARVVAAAGDARLVFLGRSPESLFDYLSGVLSAHPWQERLTLVNLSLRGTAPPGAAPPAGAAARHALRSHLELHGLRPDRIASGELPIALADLVHSGTTFRRFVSLVESWARDEAVDVTAVRRRLRIVGVTWRQKTSPNAFRWHQRALWLRTYPRIGVKNVSAPGRLWDYLGNQQSKVSPSHPPWRWTDERYASPLREESQIGALRLAVHLYSIGEQKAERRVFSSELAGTTAMRDAWCRTLVGGLRSA